MDPFGLKLKGFPGLLYGTDIVHPKSVQIKDYLDASMH